MNRLRSYGGEGMGGDFIRWYDGSVEIQNVGNPHGSDVNESRPAQN